MKRFSQLGAVVAIVAGFLLAMRFERHERVRANALYVVSDLGGRISSLPSPFGTEYYVSFAGSTLTREDINRLIVLNELARSWNYVGLSLHEAIMSDADCEYLRQKFSKVHLVPQDDNSQ